MESEAEKASLKRIHETLQAIILQLVKDPVSDEPEVVRAELARRIAAAGLTVPPEKWLTDTSVEVAAGSLVIMDANIARESEALPDPEETT